MTMESTLGISSVILKILDKLMFIKKWIKQYSRYLSEGYGSDYLPDNVVTILGELPDYHRHIRYSSEDLALSMRIATSQVASLKKNPEAKNQTHLLRIEGSDGVNPDFPRSNQIPYKKIAVAKHDKPFEVW